MKVCIVLALSIFLIGCVLATNTVKTHRTIHAEPCNGINARKDQPIFSFPKHSNWAQYDNLPGQLAWVNVNGHRTVWRDQLGQFNSTPGAMDPIPFTSTTPDSVEVATEIRNNFFGEFLGHPSARNLNVRLKDMPAMINQFGSCMTETGTQNRPQILDTEPLTDADSGLYTNHVTLGQWLSAEGKVKIKCEHDDAGNFISASYELKLKNLLPHRTYIAEFVFEHAHPTSASPFGGVNAGGTPGSFVTDQDGDFSDKRILNFCPLEDKIYPPSADGNKPARRVLFMSVVYHSNHMSYGHQIVWSRAGKQVLHDHLIFPLLETSEKIIDDSY